MDLPKKSKINTILLLIGIIIAMYLIFKLAIPIIDKAKTNKEKLDEKEKEKNVQIEQILN